MTEAPSEYMDLFAEAAACLSKEGEHENMRSKLEYVLRPPEEA